MIQRAVLVCLISGIAAMVVGCAPMHEFRYDPVGTRGVRETHFSQAYAEEEGAARPWRGRLQRVRGGDPSGPCEGQPGACPDNGCEPYNDGHCGPLTWISALLCPDSWCCQGCGPRYWGEWYDDPTDCWDPCDRCGNYAGSTAGGPAYQHQSQGYSVPATGPAAGPASNCRNCQNSAAVSRAPASAPAGPRYASRQSPYDPRYASQQSPYAPRIISETDRVIQPATSDSVPETAQSRQTSLR